MTITDTKEVTFHNIENKTLIITQFFEGVDYVIFKKEFKSKRSAEKFSKEHYDFEICVQSLKARYMPSPELIEYRKTQAAIRDFENFLRTNDYICDNSAVSESRYYDYNGIKIRFSSHVHPFGSMTSETCIDLAANPKLIYTIKY